MQTYQYTREIPLEEGYDVIVAGGGPAGTAAAVAAGRLGARVLLVEAMGCLGGMGTSGYVTAFDPMANGEVMLVGGLMREWVEALYERGFLKPGIDPDSWRKKYHVWTQFQPEGLKLLLDEQAAEAGVEVRFFTRVMDVKMAGEKRVDGVVLQNVEGLSLVHAKAFIDATGDAALTKLTGAPVREPFRDTKHCMPSSLTQIYAGIDWSIGKAFDEQSPEGIKKLEDAYDAGEFTQCDRHLPGLSQIGKTLGYLNGGHIFGLNSLNCRSLSDGMALGRKIAQEYLRYYRKNMPCCENMELVATASLMGVRESRRIVGEYELTFEDYMARRQFPDQIAVYNKFVDIHPYTTDKAEHDRLRKDISGDARIGPGECFGLPYGILVPRGFENLWVAGRCNSSDVMVHGSIRVMPSAAMMGQAAGTAAVQAIRTGQKANALDTKTLVEDLRAQGAYLPQAETCAAMTRS